MLKFEDTMNTPTLFSMHSSNEVISLMYLLDQFVYPTLSVGFSSVTNFLSPYLPLRHSNTIVAVLSRFLIVLPIASLTRNEQYTTTCFLIILNELLNKIDYIDTVKTTSEKVVNQLVQAYCNQISNIIVLLLVIQNIDFENASMLCTVLHTVVFYTAILFNVLIVILNTRKYFESRIKYNDENDNRKIEIDLNCDTGVELTSDEEKLKRKFEAFGIALLCLAMGSASLLISFTAQLIGFVGIFLSLKLSFELITGVANVKVTVSHTYKELVTKPPRIERRHSDFMLKPLSRSGSGSVPKYSRSQSVAVGRQFFDNTLLKQTIPENMLGQNSSDSSLNGDAREDEEQNKLVTISRDLLDTRVDKIYTVGCFDLFHYGHVHLFDRMRKLGRNLIIGVHDSKSVFKLKKRVPVDSTEKRMLQVKKYAQTVFCIAGTDPSSFLQCVINIEPGESTMYVRGDDMPNFPGRQVVEKVMPIKFLSYTNGVSSTEIRKKKYSHVKADDIEYLEKHS